MAFKIDVQPELAVVEFSGQLTTDDLIGFAEVTEQYERTVGLAPRRLADLSRIIGATIGFAEMEGLAARRRTAKQPGPAKTAIVAPSDLQFGMARMFQTLNTNPQIETQVFRSRLEAEAWLQLKR